MIGTLLKADMNTTLNLHSLSNVSTYNLVVNCDEDSRLVWWFLTNAFDPNRPLV